MSTISRTTPEYATHVVVKPCRHRMIRAFFSSIVSCAYSGSSLSSTRYFEISMVRIAIPSVSKNLCPTVRIVSHEDGDEDGTCALGTIVRLR